MIADQRWSPKLPSTQTGILNFPQFSDVLFNLTLRCSILPCVGLISHHVKLSISSCIVKIPKFSTKTVIKPIRYLYEPPTRCTRRESVLLLPGPIVTSRKRSLGQGNIFSIVCQEFCPQGRGLPQCMLGYHTPWDQAPPPGADTPQDQAPPLRAGTPHWDQHPPCTVHAVRYGQQVGGHFAHQA